MDHLIDRIRSRLLAIHEDAKAGLRDENETAEDQALFREIMLMTNPQHVAAAAVPEMRVLFEYIIRRTQPN